MFVSVPFHRFTFKYDHLWILQLTVLFLPFGLGIELIMAWVTTHVTNSLIDGT